MSIKQGTRIQVSGWDAAFNETWENARIARTTPRMKPIPDGFHPVKFDDGGVLMVHESRFRIVDNAA